MKHQNPASPVSRSFSRIRFSATPRIASPAKGKKEHGRILSPCLVHFASHELPESDALLAAHSECNGYNHFKVVNVIADAVRLPNVPHCVKFTHFLVLVDGADCLADMAGEHPKQVGYLELRHTHGSGRHSDRTRFADCYDSSVHNIFT